MQLSICTTLSLCRYAIRQPFQRPSYTVLARRTCLLLTAPSRYAPYAVFFSPSLLLSLTLFFPLECKPTYSMYVTRRLRRQYLTSIS